MKPHSNWINYTYFKNDLHISLYLNFLYFDTSCNEIRVHNTKKYLFVKNFIFVIYHLFNKGRVDTKSVLNQGLLFCKIKKSYLSECLKIHKLELLFI